MGLYGHDTDLMGEWSGNLDSSNNSYSDLVNQLYDLFARFLNSPSFSGGLSEQLSDQSGEQRKRFLDFSESFEEISGYVNSRANFIDDETQRLSKEAAQGNQMDF